MVMGPIVQVLYICPVWAMVAHELAVDHAEEFKVTKVPKMLVGM
jgi:hypothetical protein